MKIITGSEIERQFNIALVISRFNDAVTDKLYEGAIARLQELEFSDEQITVVWVPGAVEIPLMAQCLSRTNRYQAIVCLGAVIRGETTHYDYVCQQVSSGCQRVALDHKMPVIFGILTTENREQALERVGGKHGHKGKDAVDTAIQMVSLLAECSR